MRIARPSVLSSSLSLLLGLLAVAAPANLATSQYPTPLPAPPSLLARFDVNAGTVQMLQPVFAGNREIAVPIVIGGANVTMVLHQHEMRSATFQLLVQDALGIQQVPTPPCTTYRGTLLEEPTTEVAASIIDGSVSAIVYRLPVVPGNPGENWVVQPVQQVNAAAGPSLHVVYRATDTMPLPYQCGNGIAPAVPLPPPPIGLDTTYECQIAIEADIQFYQLNGSNVTTTQNDITSVMNQVEFIYDRDCDIQYSITTILVTTVPVYTTNNAGSLLSQFAGQWNSVHAGIQRDLAHLFTGRNLDSSTIGIAQLSSVCNIGSAYGLSQSRFTTNFNSRVGLTCHEIGHGWSAQHCNAASPCYIMCSGLGGCSGNVTLFGPTEIGQIVAFAATRPCLTVVMVPPQITAATPNNVTVFSPGNVTLTGQGFTGTTSYSVGTQVFTSGFGLMSDNSMFVAMPPSTTLGPTTISVTTPLGTSNQFPVSYLLTSPPKLKTTSSIPPSGGIASFDFAGTPGRLWFLLLGITNTTTPFQGFPLLTPNLVLTTGVFPGPLGIDNVSIPVPPGLGLLIFYLQVLEAHPTLPVATGTTNIGVTILL